jgi:DNA-binding transcriptional LysR family regulator
LSFETVLEEQVVVAMPDVHPLSQRSLVRLSDLVGESLVLLTPAGSPGLRAALATSIAQLGGEERIIQEVAEMQTVIGLVAAGVGISLVPESVRALVRHGVTYRPLDDTAPAVRLAMAWRATDDSPVLTSFLEKARAAAPAEGERGRRGPARN